MKQTDSLRQQQAVDTVPVSVADSVAAAKPKEAAAEARSAETAPSRPAVSMTAVPSRPVAPDSVTADSVAATTKEYGILLSAPELPDVPPRQDESFGMSFILGGMLLLFCIIGIRFRNNGKYITTMLRNMVQVRMRGNAFDETVRETSFLVLLNLLWSCSAGIILWGVLCSTVVAGPPWFSIGVPAILFRTSASIAICVGIGIIYTCLMALAYLTVGTVFSDRVHAQLWLKGFAAGTGFLCLIYFPLSLLLLFYPEWSEILLWIALTSFLMAKIVFIWKGFRIFFTQISSWVLFLYYLCSLEIVPLILTYLAALQLCSLL